MIILNGKKIQEEILASVKTEVAFLGFQPVFCDVFVGEDPVSSQYVRMKERMAESVGISFHKASFPASISTEDLIKEIKKINEMQNMCGVIVQLPLPDSLDRRAVLDAIDPELDVDCLGTVSSEKFYSGKPALSFPTALACMTLLDSTGLDLKGLSAGGADKKIVVLGNGELVGKPVSALLHFRGLSSVTVTRDTQNKEELIKQADVIISGMGNGKYITGDMIKNGAVLIDAGTSESTGGIVGDVDLESVRDIAGYVSPVPGGVGPVTVAQLLNNVLQVAKTKNNEQ